MNAVTPSFDHPIWKAVLGLLVGYGIVLGIVFVLFFLVPSLLF
ncbi:MAG: hypothetical protein ACOCSP_00665 [archaeon]